MSKSNRIYKIFMTTMIVAIAGMLLAMGIIAAQRTMKVNVAFPANPYYKIEIWIQKNGDEEKLAFCNFEDKDLDKEIVMQNGILSLDGNTIQADNSFFTKYENEFYIIIKNYTESTGIEVSMSSTGQVDENTAGIPAQFDPIKTTASKFNTTTKIPDYIKFDVFANAVFPQTTTLKMTISEYNVYNLSFSGAVTNTPSEMVAGESYTTTITPNPNYKLPDTITVKQDGVTLTMGTHYSWNPENGQLEIFEVTGEILITCDAILSECTITFDWNNDVDGLAVTYDGNTNPPSTTTYTPGVSQALPNPTKDGCEFLGWTYPGKTKPQKDLNASTLSGDLTLTANWGATLKAGEGAWDEGIIFILRDKFYERTETDDVSYTIVFTSLTSITYGYWDDYKTDVLANSFTNSDSENTLANGIPIDAGGTGSIKLFGNGAKAYILSPNKIFANADAAYLCANSYSDGGDYSIHHKLESVTMDNLDTSKVTNMYQMFADCSGLQEIDLSNFDTSNVTNMSSMFHSCNSLTSLDLSNFNTSKVINMSSMFYGCSGLQETDLGDFNTSKVTNMSFMFYGCSGLETIYVGNSWSTANVSNSSYMFSGCTTKLKGAISWNSSNATDKTYANYETGYLTLKN